MKMQNSDDLSTSNETLLTKNVLLKSERQNQGGLLDQNTIDPILPITKIGLTAKVYEPEVYGS